MPFCFRSCGLALQMRQFWLGQPLAISLWHRALWLSRLGRGFRFAKRFRGSVKPTFSPIFFKLGHARILSYCLLASKGFDMSESISSSTGSSWSDLVGGGGKVSGWRSELESLAVGSAKREKLRVGASDFLKPLSQTMGPNWTASWATTFFGKFA